MSPPSTNGRALDGFKAARLSTEPNRFRVSSLCGDRGVPVSSSAFQLRELTGSGLVQVLTVDISEKSFHNDANLCVHVGMMALDSAEVPRRCSDPEWWFWSVRSELSTSIALCRNMCPVFIGDGCARQIGGRGLGWPTYRRGENCDPSGDDTPLLRRTAPVSCPFESTLETPGTKGSVLVKHHFWLLHYAVRPLPTNAL